MQKLKSWVEKNGGARKIARRIGVSPHTIYNWFQGSNAPRMIYAQRLIKISKGKLSANDFLK
jgi:DNA-binding XRE family transcriptional regulator